MLARKNNSKSRKKNYNGTSNWMEKKIKKNDEIKASKWKIKHKIDYFENCISFSLLQIHLVIFLSTSSFIRK